MKEKKKIFPSRLHPINNFLVGQSHQQTPQRVILSPVDYTPTKTSSQVKTIKKAPRWVASTLISKVIFPNRSHTKDFLVGQNYQENSSMGHQHTPWHIILLSRSFDLLISQNTKVACAHILWELNIQAWIPYKLKEKVQNLCTYLEGIEHAGIDPIQARRESTELVHIS